MKTLQKFQANTNTSVFTEKDRDFARIAVELEKIISEQFKKTDEVMNNENATLEEFGVRMYKGSEGNPVTQNPTEFFFRVTTIIEK